MANTKHLLILGLAVLTVTRSYATYTTHAYVYMTNHPKSVDHYVYVHDELGFEARSKNFETRYNGEVCYNLTNYVLKSMGSMGNHYWMEVIFGEDCVAGRTIIEHRLTEEEPFIVTNIYWYNSYLDDSEYPPTCTPDRYKHRVIFTRSKDPDENVKEMIEKYVQKNNIKGLYKQDPSECDI